MRATKNTIRNNEIVTLLKEGITRKVIASRFNISRERVRQIGYANGFLELAAKRRKEIKKAIIPYLLKGASYKILSNKFNLHVRSIRYYARREDILVPSKIMWKKITPALLKEIKKGTPCDKSAKIFNISREQAILFAKKHSLKFKRPDKGDEIKKLLKKGFSP
ncbi:MAG: helix-turn-helix domain-containing protein, partial [Bacteroidota bacterium]